MDVTSKIEDLTRKQAAMEEKISRLDCEDVLLRDQNVRERKVLLRQHWDLKVRLRNLRSRLKEKTRPEGIPSQKDKSPEIVVEEMNREEAFKEVSATENDIDGSECSLDESFYTACGSIGPDIASDSDEMEDDEEEEVRPVVALQPVLDLQKTKLIREEESQQCWGREEKTETELELESQVGRWVRRNKSSILQQVRLKLAEEQRQGQGERSG